MSTPLETFLAALPAGPVANKATVEQLLSEEWNSLAGSATAGMGRWKVLRRTENMEWHPPILTFALERHGATVKGSTRAEVQFWHVDVDAWTAIPVKSKRRQLYRMSRKLDVRPLAARVANSIVQGLDSLSLKRYPDGRVKVQIATVVPDEGFLQTTSTRRKRFRLALEPLLAEAGWVPIGVNTYHRKAS